MPDTKGYPRSKEGKNAYIKKCYETVHKEQPTLSQQAILGKCEGMWRGHWNKKKESNASLTEEEFWNDFDFSDCPECVEMAHNQGYFEIDIPNKKF